MTYKSYKPNAFWHTLHGHVKCLNNLTQRSVIGTIEYPTEKYTFLSMSTKRVLVLPFLINKVLFRLMSYFCVAKLEILTNVLCKN